eukprot:CAMPEP_0205939552 /NCGR_PEP_ID=MMETSP1325-20131115/49937_1 /ASSEMBLY_ACC=CAM_ASM_000708 /TAXON_ID=236786 /ORGANISM="Florenciella sp., Strain RCC1007" /LENGTH=72 /DNA_ID=CAMNT_0053310029 /DNA_START=20 /DNA_END=235 /DNA_ORIENTATION=+
MSKIQPSSSLSSALLSLLCSSSLLDVRIGVVLCPPARGGAVSAESTEVGDPATLSHGSSAFLCKPASTSRSI